MKFDMSLAWNEAVAMIRANAEVLLVVAGIFFFLPSLVMTLAMPAMGQMAAFDPENLQAISAEITQIYADWWWLILIAFVLQLVGYLSLLALLRDYARPTVGEAIKTGFTGLLPAIGTYLLFSIGLGLALMVIFAPFAALGLAALAAIAILIALAAAVYAMVKVSLSAPVIAIEKVFNPLAVLVRSWQLTKGNSLRIFGFFLLIGIVYFVLSILVGMVIMGLLTLLGDEAGAIVNGVLSGLLGTITTVVFVAVLAAIHRQLAGPSTAAVSETFK